MSKWTNGNDIVKEVSRKIIDQHMDGLDTDLQGFLGFEQQGRDFIISYLPMNPPIQYAGRPMTYKIGFPEERQPHVHQRLSEIMEFGARAREMTPLTGRRGAIFLGLPFSQAAYDPRTQFMVTLPPEIKRDQSMQAANSNTIPTLNTAPKLAAGPV